MTFEVQVYEIMLKRIVRRFKLRNPEYSREREEREEQLHRERIEKE